MKDRSFDPYADLEEELDLELRRARPAARRPPARRAARRLPRRPPRKPSGRKPPRPPRPLPRPWPWPWWGGPSLTLGLAEPEPLPEPAAEPPEEPVEEPAAEPAAEPSEPAASDEFDFRPYLPAGRRRTRGYPMRRTSMQQAEPFESEWGFETGELFEAPPPLVHPRLGTLWSEPQQEVQGPAPIAHPRLGYILSVPRGSVAEVLDEIEPEILPPTDDRRPVRDTRPAPFRWICSLRLNFGPDPRDRSRDLVAVASGTLISPRHVLTVGHALFDDFRPALNIVRGVQTITVVPGRNGLLPNQAIFGSSRAAGWRFPAAWQARFDLQSDFGLITLKERLGDHRQSALGGRPLGFWGSPSLGGGSRIRPVNPVAALRGQAARISGYPGDKCRDQPPVGGLTPAQSLACPPGDRSSVQWQATGRITNPSPAGAPRLLLYDMDTVGGHSGSPVWTTRDLNLVGVHTGPGRFVPGEPPAVSNRGVRVTAELLRELQVWRGQPPVTPAPSRPTLRTGSRGVAVFELQTRLNLWLLDNPSIRLPLLVVDGIFGPKTRQAVITFQKTLRLLVDGIVGPQTWGALLKVLPPLP